MHHHHHQSNLKVLKNIRDVYPGSGFFSARLLRNKKEREKKYMRCLTFFRDFSQFKNLKLLNFFTGSEKDSSRLTKCSLPKKLFLSPRNYGRGPGSRKTYPGSRGETNSGSGSATLIKAIFMEFFSFFSLLKRPWILIFSFRVPGN
jgi:hypothetical protein